MHAHQLDRVSAPSSSALLSSIARSPALSKPRLTKVPNKTHTIALDVGERMHTQLERGRELGESEALAHRECAGVCAWDVQRDAPRVGSHEKGEWCSGRVCSLYTKVEVLVELLNFT